MKAILLSILIFLSACGSIPQDNTIPPIDANLFTLEMASCGKRDVGILGCPMSETGVLEVPLFYQGEYQVKSNECSFHENKRYKGNQVLKFNHRELLSGIPEGDFTCIFDVMVFIDGMDKGLRGQFLLSKLKYKWSTFEMYGQKFAGIGGVQIREGSDSNTSIEFKLNSPGLIFWEGCQKNGEKTYRSNPKIKLQEIFKDFITQRVSCVLNVGIIPDNINEPVQYGKLSISVFDKSAVSLPEPLVIKDGLRLKVEADPVVAAIAIGDDFKIERGNDIKRHKSKIDHTQEVYVRAMTANGRYILLKVVNGEIVWKNFIAW